ncbi:ExbD/TolR family protein [Kingella kingae]|uniref:ExbD/TolR family protein n=1 Tax=Kingella kingae TaxID=504 RepID=UPI00041B338D|nr:biopolymer transporter ExbD [Kingella kingae]
MAFGSMNDDGDDAPMSDINVTPLVDVMLVLLIVFMITMPVMTHSIPLNLPTANGRQQTPPPTDNIKPVEIAIDAAGDYAIGADSTQKVNLEAIKTRLQEIAKQDPDTIVAIDADSSVAYEHVYKILEASREAGLSKVGIRGKVENAAK